jgi:hypothetical protein
MNGNARGLAAAVNHLLELNHPVSGSFDSGRSPCVHGEALLEGVCVSGGSTSKPGGRGGSPIDEFISTWSGREGGREKSNYALFLTQFCRAIGVPEPDPAEASNELNDYVFERYVERRAADGTRERGFIDLYKRDCFILEAKQSRQKGGKKALPEGQGDLFSEPKISDAHEGFDVLMINARRQAEGYAQSLPSDHSYPPFLISCDVGRVLEVYADFSGHGRRYAPFPDALTFRIDLHQIAHPAIRDRLNRIWINPKTLDPAQQTARVTREIAGKLAEISKALEARGFEAGPVALFLMRCLFTMFVEDSELIRKDSFKELLDRCLQRGASFLDEMCDLWKHMDVGDYSPAIGEKLLRFNGKLFKNADALPLTRGEIKLLREAASADWRELEPAIFGTLFEQALKQEDRKRLGAHYTPATYVELLVNATIMDVLSADWVATQSAVERALAAGSRAVAIREIQDFLRDLASTRVLDPASGTGNFLYVALRQMKQLEGEVIKQLYDLGGSPAVEAVAGVSVKPDQFIGIELNRRAVEIAELVLWIGYLQWHLRTRNAAPVEPILGDSDHIQEKDALLEWDGYPERQPKRDRVGAIASDMEAYPNPRRPEWQDADFIVGNPPFIGGKDIRGRLGQGRTEALWRAHKHMNRSADYVMYWWDHAAELLTRKNTRLRRFGLVTTNSAKQIFQSRVIERHLKASTPVSLVMAIPDHPWTKASKDAAAVRIAMTVVEAGQRDGMLKRVTREAQLDTDQPIVEFAETTGRINSDLTIGSDVGRAAELLAVAGLSSRGVVLHGDGFIVARDKAGALGLGSRPGLEQHIREYRNGRDLTARSRDVLVIDLFGLRPEDVRSRFPEVYEHLLETVKPERDRNRDKDIRENWWIFGRPRTEIRPALAGLRRYIATVETMQHRLFCFLSGDILPDNKLVVVASDDAYVLGVLSSRAHVAWSLATGGTLEDRPTYPKSRCFDAFPFPEASEAVKNHVRKLAEELNQTRNAVLAEHVGLTMTSLYNVLEKVRVGELLSPKEETIRTHGRVLTIKDLHGQIDAAIFGAYGWDINVSDERAVERLLALNMTRAAEERTGFIRWLRPAYQMDKFGALVHRADRVQEISVGRARAKALFPNEPKAQAAQVLRLMRRSESPLTPRQIALAFKQGERVIDDVHDLLRSLTRLGEARTYDNGRSYLITAA